MRHAQQAVEFDHRSAVFRRGGGGIHACILPTCRERGFGNVLLHRIDMMLQCFAHGIEGRLKEEVRPEVQAWLDKVGEYNNKLVQPRMVKIGLPEFETDEAKKYFIDKKEKSIGNFETNLNKTAQYLERLHQDLAELEALVCEGEGLGGEISLEDILTFPILRNLTVVRGIQWPQKVMDYLLAMSERSGVALYFDRAL